MNTKDVANKHNCTERHIRALAKKANQLGSSTIKVDGVCYSFSITSNEFGKLYDFKPLKDAKAPKTKRVSYGKLYLDELPKIKDLDNVDMEEKKELISYYKSHNTSIKAMAEGYNIIYDNKYNIKALSKRFERWVKAYEQDGIEALKEKRGGNNTKIDHELFLQSLVKNGHIQTYYARYCAFWCSKNGKEIDIFNPKSNISYEGFKQYYHKKLDTVEVKALLYGKDYLSELLPVFSSKKDGDYPNELWQIDATKIDIMAKVPIFDGEVDSFCKCESEQYTLKRFSLVGVVDVFTGARVYELFNMDNSYSDVRLLLKAIKILGKPEAIKGDNGKNYVSSHFQNVLDDLGIVYINATPYKGSEKGKIERGFRTLQHFHLFENLAGFTGHNTAQKMAIENQATKKSERRGLPTTLKEDFLWWWELSSAIDGIVHHKFGQKLQQHTNIETIENIDIIVGKKEIRKLQREGITINKTLYKSVRIWEKATIGDELTIYEDIDNVNRVFAKIDDEFIELLSSKEFSISAEEAKEIKKAYKTKANKRIKAIAKSGQDNLDKLNQIIKEELVKDIKLEEKQKFRVVDTQTTNNDDYGLMEDIKKWIGK